MAESVLLGAAIGGGGAALTGNDPLKGAAIGGAMGGASAGFGGAGVSSGAEAAASNMPSHLTSTAGAGATANAGANFVNPALTNGMGESSNMFTQFGRDASEMATNAYDNVTDTIGQGFDYINDKTGMENKDWTQMGLSQGINAMQPDPQQPIQAAPMGQGISRPNVDLSKTAGSLLTSNPLLQEKLRQQGLL